MLFKLLWNEFALLSEVEAIALGGSRAGTHYDEKSDYDLYIYCSKTPEPDIRKQILEKYCQYMEIGNSFWELEDDCTLKNGVDIDILYRNIENFSQEIHSVVKKHIAHNGYTTCMWHNLLHSQILYDKNGKLATIQRQYDIPYPDSLKEHIIQQNLRLLRGNLPSYDLQIKKAITRKDQVSVNHRTAAFLESYFDIIFALNKLTHPGEKRMVQYAKEQTEILPVNFEENLNCLFQNLFTDSDIVLQTLSEITSSLENIIEADNPSAKASNLRRDSGVQEELQMQVIEYFNCHRAEHWLRQIGKSDWGAGQYLYELLSKKKLADVVGENPKVLMLTNGDELISFCTYSEKDDIQPTVLTPWIGFVYTFPQYRGHRHAGKLFLEIEKLAKAENIQDIFISTNHTGLYEKYGCVFYQMMNDMHGEPSRVYKKHID